MTTMLSKLKEPEIHVDEPFRNCKLGRQKYANILTKIVGTYTKGCVLAINGEWGTGKTTFVKMWQRKLEIDGFRTLYFNAWECDFVSDPLIGLIGELQELDKTARKEENFKSLVDNVSKIILPIVTVCAKGWVERRFGESVANVLEAGMDSLSEVCVNEIHEFKEQCKSIGRFRETLTELVGRYNSGKPLIFIVDELDRCNPAYAVKMLERIKHLFNIPNIVFVLSMDKRQLCSSVRGYYGSDSINAEEYLRRFIDVEYLLPDPNVKAFCNYLWEAYDFEHCLKTISSRFPNDNDKFIEISVILFDNLHLSLRQMERLYAYMRLVLSTFGDNYHLHPRLLLILLYLRMQDMDFYQSLKRKGLAIQDVVNTLENEIFQKIKEKESADKNSIAIRLLTFETARLLVCYSLNRSEVEEKLLTKEENNASILSFNTKIIDQNILKEAMSQFKSGRTSYYKQEVFDLTLLLDHIDLLNDIQEQL